MAVVWVFASVIAVAEAARDLTGYLGVGIMAVGAWFFGLVCFVNVERRGQHLREQIDLETKRLAAELMGENQAPDWLFRAKQMYPTYPKCPGCGQAPADQTIFPEEPGGHFGTCSHKFHDYPWMNNET